MTGKSASSVPVMIRHIASFNLTQWLWANNLNYSFGIKMKLVFEMKESVPYLYFESEKHFKVAQKERKLTQETISSTKLAYECNMSEYGDNFHIIIPVKRSPKRKNK